MTAFPVGAPPVECALWAAERFGACVGPLKQKEPYGTRLNPGMVRGSRSWKVYASSVPDDIREAFEDAPDADGYFIVLDSLLVVDVDDPTAMTEETPPTFEVTTGKGTHHYYRATGFTLSERGGTTWPAGDIKHGKGAYVAGPGSAHPSGAVYTLAADRELVDTPEWAAQRMRDKATGGTVKLDGPGIVFGDRDVPYEDGGTVHASVVWYPHVAGLLALPESADRSERAYALIGAAKLDYAGPEEALAVLDRLWPLADEYTVARLARDIERSWGALREPYAAAPVAPLAIDDVHSVFRRWLGEDYDLESLDIVLATAAVERLDGDPVWLLVVSGSGNAKTETVLALSRVATITSTIASEGALLSASSKRDRATDATGGLLRSLGASGILVIKDFTTILSMSGDARSSVLAALREVYDGLWERNVGTDGGKTLTWEGRLVVIGAVTSAWDAAYAAIAAMGDRFALVRTSSRTNRPGAGRRALGNVGHEVEMRTELADAVWRLLYGQDVARAQVSDEFDDELLSMADVVTLARSAVERDYRGDVFDAYEPEAPTRFAKQLKQIVRGARSIGISDPMALARRVARDSLPPLRLAVLEDIAEYPNSTVSEIARRTRKPWSTVDRICKELDAMGLLVKEENTDVVPGDVRRGWRYTIAPEFDITPIRGMR